MTLLPRNTTSPGSPAATSRWSSTMRISKPGRGRPTVVAMVSTSSSPDGWLRTGDIGVVDGAGCLRIVGRIKDMFIVGGFNAYPAEIEGFLLNHPAVAQVAVIGVSDERLGQVGKAFVVRSSDLEARELIDWCRDQMAGFKVPRSVEFLDALPLNATGKVVKDLLR